MAIEIFNRQELKFLISRAQMNQMIVGIQPYTQFDTHNKNGQTYALYNLYIDTSDHALIRHSMTRPVYKEKIRIRSYRQLSDDTIVFLELKKRYKRITNKRRTKIRYKDALTLIESGKVPKFHEYMNRQVIRELETTLSTHNYYPKTYISYDRLAFFSTNHINDLRLTFDSNLRTRRYDGSKEHELLGSDKIIMEVKSSANIPLWLVALLDNAGVQKQSFSKYGQEHLRYLRTNMLPSKGVTHA